MTFGEMNKWTKRLNQILGGAQCLKQKRLRQLFQDFALAYLDKADDDHVQKFTYAIFDEVEGDVMEGV